VLLFGPSLRPSGAASVIRACAATGYVLLLGGVTVESAGKTILISGAQQLIRLLRFGSFRF